MILGIVQARLGSTRLPAKALLPMGNSTMVGYVADVISLSDVDETILCTPDEMLSDFVNCETIVWKSRRDIIAELFHAIAGYLPRHIVRVTADCPFLKPEIINIVLKEHLSSGADYTYNHNDFLHSVTKEGVDVEVITYEALEKIYLRGEEKEHLVTSTDGMKCHRVDMDIKEEVFSVNTLDDYIRAYKEISYGFACQRRRGGLG